MVLSPVAADRTESGQAAFGARVGRLKNANAGLSRDGSTSARNATASPSFASYREAGLGAPELPAVLVLDGHDLAHEVAVVAQIELDDAPVHDLAAGLDGRRGGCGFALERPCLGAHAQRDSAAP